MGIFITFEGLDSCGKSTQLNLTKARLIKCGHEIVTTREPGGTHVGDGLRKILLKTEYNIDTLTELFLFMAARTQLTKDVIIPALCEGKIVLSDRFIDSSIAYQGTSLPLDLIDKMHSYPPLDIRPSLTIYIDISFVTFLNRYSSLDRIEKKGRAFFEKVRENYKILVKKNPKRIKLVNGEQPIEVVHHQITQLLEKFLSKP